MLVYNKASGPLKGSPSIYVHVGYDGWWLQVRGGSLQAGLRGERRDAGSRRNKTQHAVRPASLQLPCSCPRPEYLSILIRSLPLPLPLPPFTSAARRTSA